MDSTTPSQDVQALINPRQKVNPTTLIDWVRNDMLDAAQANLFGSVLMARRTRECWWPSKSAYGENIDQPYGTCDKKPWKGAIDHEVRVVDGQCNEETDLALLAFFRSEKIVRPRDAMNDEQTRKAAAWRNAVEFYLDATKKGLLANLELFASAISETGKAVWYEDWKDQWRKGRKTMQWAEVVASVTDRAISEALANTGLEELPPEAAQEIALQVAAGLEALRIDPTLKQDLKDYIADIDPALVDPKEITKIQQGFSKGEDAVDYFAPIKVTPLPIHRAHLIGVDCFFPAMSRATEDQMDAIPRMAFVEWYTEARLRTESAQYGWDKDFTADVLKYGAGLALDMNGWNQNGVGAVSSASSWELNGYDIGMVYNQNSLRNAGLYQIVTLWFWGVGDDGLPAPFKAILHPIASPTRCGLQECDPFGHGRMPYLLKTRNVKRSLAIGATGVATEMFTNQLGRKKIEDGMISQTELRSNPPMKETTERSGQISPGARLTVTNRSVGRDGDMFLDVPDISSGSIEMLRWLKSEKDAYYCTGAETDPDAKRSRRYVQISKWCAIYEDIIGLMCLNIQKGSPDLQLGSVGGVAVDWEIKNEDLQGELDVVVRCDEGTIDIDLAKMKLEIVNKLIVPLNNNSELNTGEIMRRALNVVWPEVAGAGISTTAEAADRIKRDENNRISGMCNGVMPDWNKQADGPQVRMAALQEWEQTPGNVERFRADQTLQEFHAQEQAWIQFAIDQQITNPQTGRTGVDSKKVQEKLQTQNQPV